MTELTSYFDFAPPGAKGWGPIEAWTLFLKGGLAMTVTWPPLFRLAVECSVDPSCGQNCIAPSYSLPHVGQKTVAMRQVGRGARRFARCRLPLADSIAKPLHAT